MKTRLSLDRWVCLGAVVLIFFPGWAVPVSRAELPPLFEGELAVCKNVEGAMDGGQALSDALLSNLQGLFSNDTDTLQSIRRTFIHNAITICGFDSSAVIEAAYLAGLPINLIVGSAITAGVDQSIVTAVFLEMGVEPQAVEIAARMGEGPGPEDRTLSPALAIGSGLGQASPYLP